MQRRHPHGGDHLKNQEVSGNGFLNQGDLTRWITLSGFWNCVFQNWRKVPKPCPLVGMPAGPGTLRNGGHLRVGSLLKIEAPPRHAYTSFFWWSPISPLVEKKPLYGLLGVPGAELKVDTPNGKPLPIFGEPLPVETTGQGAADQGGGVWLLGGVSG